MQTFSTMRRNSTHQNNLRFFLLIVFYVFYLALSDFYFFLPPLFGVVYVLAQEKYEEKTYGVFYFLIPFLIYFEANKGLPFLSTFLFILVSFRVILPKFRKFFGYSKIFIPLFIFYAYFGYFAFLSLFGYIFDRELPDVSLLIAFYCVCEVILVWFFMWIL